MPHLNRNPNRGSRFTFHVSRFKAFSLLEFIGVLGIIALIAAALIPNVIKRIDRAAWVKEKANLAALSEGFIRYVLKTNVIPGEQGWSQAVATQLGIASSDVSANSRRLARAFLIDTNGWLAGTTLNAASGWTQGPGGTGTTTSPANVRFMIVSSLAGKLPGSLLDLVHAGARPSTAIFNDIWNTAEGAKPTSGIWGANYAGTADDLLIQRINLESVFHKLVLVNNDIGSPAPNFFVSAYAISAPNPVPAGAGWTSYFLDGTLIGLCSNGTLTVKETMRKDVGRVFETGYWRDEIGTGAQDPGGLAKWASLFFNSAAPPNEKWGSNPKGVSQLLSAFMYGYASWANQAPCFGSAAHNNNDKNLAEYQLLNAVMQNFTSANGANGGGLLVPP